MASSTDAGADLTAEVDLAARPQGRTDLHDVSQRKEVEQALCAVPGVLGARLVPGFERQVDELHVLTSLDKAPKQTVRDVQTVLMARFGVPTDHRVVSVVQLDESEALASTARVIIEKVGITQTGLAASAEVTVRDGDDVHRATVSGATSPSGRHRSVAQATLSALEPLVENAGLIEVEGVDVVRIGGADLAVAVMHVRTSRARATLSGSAVVRDSSADAVARAVLDALNRTITEER